jgi:hypothetical protein
MSRHDPSALHILLRVRLASLRRKGRRWPLKDRSTTSGDPSLVRWSSTIRIIGRRPHLAGRRVRVMMARSIMDTTSTRKARYMMRETNMTKTRMMTMTMTMTRMRMMMRTRKMRSRTRTQTSSRHTQGRQQHPTRRRLLVRLAACRSRSWVETNPLQRQRTAQRRQTSHRQSRAAPDSTFPVQLGRCHSGSLLQERFPSSARYPRSLLSATLAATLAKRHSPSPRLHRKPRTRSRSAFPPAQGKPDPKRLLRRSISPRSAPAASRRGPLLPLLKDRGRVTGQGLADCVGGDDATQVGTEEESYNHLYSFELLPAKAFTCTRLCELHHKFLAMVSLLSRAGSALPLPLLGGAAQFSRACPHQAQLVWPSALRSDTRRNGPSRSLITSFAQSRVVHGRS